MLNVHIGAFSRDFGFWFGSSSFPPHYEAHAMFLGFGYRAVPAKASNPKATLLNHPDLLRDSMKAILWATSEIAIVLQELQRRMQPLKPPQSASTVTPYSQYPGSASLLQTSLTAPIPILGNPSLEP